MSRLRPASAKLSEWVALSGLPPQPPLDTWPVREPWCEARSVVVAHCLPGLSQDESRWERAYGDILALLLETPPGTMVVAGNDTSGGDRLVLEAAKELEMSFVIYRADGTRAVSAAHRARPGQVTRRVSVDRWADEVPRAPRVAVAERLVQRALVAAQQGWAVQVLCLPGASGREPELGDRLVEETCLHLGLPVLVWGDATGAMTEAA